jgi:hypothetical protein
MPAWKVLFIMAFGCVCLALVLGTLLVPLALTPEENKWLWFGGLLLGSACAVTLYTLFLKGADRNFMREESPRGR